MTFSHLINKISSTSLSIIHPSLPLIKLINSLIFYNNINGLIKRLQKDHPNPLSLHRPDPSPHPQLLGKILAALATQSLQVLSN